MLGDMNRQSQQFNMLYDFEFVRGRKSKFAHVSVVDLVGDLFVDTFGRQWYAKLSLMALLSTAFGLFTTIGLLRGWLRDKEHLGTQPIRSSIDLDSLELNIAEGNGKYTSADRCRFFDTARASALECAACLDVLVAKKGP